MPVVISEAGGGGDIQFREHGFDISQSKTRNSSFEELVKKQIERMREGDVFSFLQAPNKAIIKVMGNKGAGVIGADELTVQINGNEAKLLLSTRLSRRLNLKDEGATIQDMYEAIEKSKKREELSHISQILYSLSESGVNVTSITKLGGRFHEAFEKIVEQNWVDARMSEPLTKKLYEKFEEMSKHIVDEKTDGVEIVGWGDAKAIDLHNGVVIKVKGKQAAIYMADKFTFKFKDDVKKRSNEIYILRGHESYTDEQTTIRYPQLIEGDEKYAAYLSAIASLKANEVSLFYFKYLIDDVEKAFYETREGFALPKQLKAELDAGKSVADAVDKVLGETGIAPAELADRFREAGVPEYTNMVKDHLDSLRESRHKVSRLLEEWIQTGVTGKEMLESLKSQQISGRMLEEEIERINSNMKGVKTRIASCYERIKEMRKVGGSIEHLESLIKEDTALVEKNQKMLEKAQEALKLLRDE